MSSRASADSATVRKGEGHDLGYIVYKLQCSCLTDNSVVKAIQAKKRKGKIAKKPPENKLR